VAQLRARPRLTALLAFLCALAGSLVALGWVPDSTWRSEGQRLYRAWTLAALWWSLAVFCAHASYRGLLDQRQR
jgi:hypothetical protein